MVFETVLVSALSSAFYTAMALSLNYPLTMNRLLLFAFLGSSLYMIFSLLTSMAKVFSKMLSIPKSILGSIFGIIKRFQTPEHIKNHRNLSRKVGKYTDKVENLSKKLEQNHTISHQKENVSEQNEDKEVKEVVLNKVKDDKDDEEEEDNNSEEFRI